MANNAESLRDLFRGGDTILSKSKLFESIRLWLEGKMPSPTRQPIQMALVAPLGIFSIFFAAVRDGCHDSPSCISAFGFM